VKIRNKQCARDANTTLSLSEGVNAVEELALSTLVEEDFDAGAWAREQIGKWRAHG
jgi:hypothetical protein